MTGDECGFGEQVEAADQRGAAEPWVLAGIYTSVTQSIKQDD